ncbi:MAG: CehA/McbA family metallohydrolase, partial [Mycobacterium sp.]|nr:CehA/McbA family metallohydrolase [Mycobacterium sp.]
MSVRYNPYASLPANVYKTALHFHSIRTIWLSGVQAGDTVYFTTSGLTFTAHATTTTVSARQFSIAGTDAQDAAELATCLNDATYGVPGGGFTADGATVQTPFLNIITTPTTGRLLVTGSDGDVSQADRVTAYEAAGFDVAICSDHDTINSNPGVGGILWIPGVEETITDQSEPAGHIVTFPTYTANSSAAAQTVIDVAVYVGMISCLAHPNMNSPNILPIGDGSGNAGFTAAECIALTGYHTIEIDNVYAQCGEATDVWDAVLSTGRQVYGHAGDDCHQASALGRLWNMVYANAATQDDICRAIRAGQFYATRGPLLTIAA